MICCLTFSILLFSALATSVSAHPLGNFTINHYARIELATTELQLYIVYDYAEIPTFQEKQTIDRNGDGTITEDERTQYVASSLEKLRANLTLNINGKTPVLSLVRNSVQLEFLPGQGGLEIMQLRARYSAPLDLNTFPLRIQYRDENYPERLGWREIVAKAAEGLTITESNVRATETSNELRNYPQDLLSNPLNDREATLSVTRGTTVVAPSTPGAQIGDNTSLSVVILAGVITIVVILALFLILRQKRHFPT